VCHEQVYHQHQFYRANLHLDLMNEQVKAKGVDLHLVMHHLRLVELNEHVVFGVFLSRK
jgi:hypothetical protein